MGLRACGSVFATCFCSWAAWADPSPPPKEARGYDAQASSTQLAEIVVQGTGSESPTGPGKGFVASRSLTGTKTNTPLIETPQSISVVTADEIKTIGAQSVGQSLRYVAGVAGDVNGGSDNRGGGLQIRGFDVTSNSFFRDGLRLPGTSQADFNQLDPYGAERVEILKGPASVLYGQNGPGGIINYVSKRPIPETFGEVSLLGGSFGRVQGQFDMGGALNKEKTLFFRLTGVERDGHFQTDFTYDRRQYIAPAITWAPDSNTSVTLLTNYQRDRTGWGLQFLPALGTVLPNQGRFIPRERFVGEPSADAYNTDQFAVGYVAEKRFSEAFILRSTTRYAYFFNQQYLASGSGYINSDSGLLGRGYGFGKSNLGTISTDNNAQVKFDTDILSHTVLLGVDYRKTGYDDALLNSNVGPINVFNPVYGRTLGPFSTGAALRVDQSQLGVYLQDQIKFDRFTLVLAGRHDSADTTVDNRLTSADARKPASAFTGKAGLIYNFDNGVAPYMSYSQSFLPTLDVGADGMLFKPETGQQYEIGVKYQPPGWNSYVTVAAFDLTRQNAIRFSPVTFFPIQTGEIKSRGVEVEAVTSLAAGLNGRLGYSYLDTRILNDADPANIGNVPYAVPHNRFGLFADYTIQTGFWQGVGGGGGVRYVASTFGDDANSYKVPAATVFDATLFARRGPYELALNATNIFDKTYVASCFDRNFGCFYAEGRKVIARGTYRW